jgi:hypothetical protein
MPNQEQSSTGVPKKDAGRPSPDVENRSTDGQSDARGQGASEQQGRQGPAGGSGQGQGSQDYRGDGPAKIGLTSDAQPDLVAPSGVNERDHGAADDKPMGGGSVNLDDDDMAHPRGKVTGGGRTWDEKNPSDAGKLGSPNVGMSDRNGPSDPDAKRDR